MKALSKPISSPGRAEKFPTPLMMRFLRTNVGSRSRGRSRSSPMFILRSKKNGNEPPAGINETTQEPSSPKVTCIGQVRVRRSSKKNSSSSSKSKKKKIKDGRCCSSSSSSTAASVCYPAHCCPCYPSSCSCCSRVPRRRIFGCFGCGFPKHKKSFCNPFRKWVSYCHFWRYCKKVNIRDDSSRFGSTNNNRSQNHVSRSSTTNTNTTGSDIEEDGGHRNVFKETHLMMMRQRSTKQGFPKSSCCSPPKNALLLTRCRSAPYRSSSLASRFWGSPIRSSSGTETPKEDEDDDDEEDEDKYEEPEQPPPLPAVPLQEHEEKEETESRNSNEKSKEEEETSMDNSRNGKPELGKKIRRESIHPLLLTRSKSEPARTGERLNPEPNLFTQRRSDTAESCLKLPNITCD